MDVIIIEDEPLAVQELKNILHEIAPEVNVIAHTESVKESVAWLRANRADLIFSDIHLGDGRSFDIFRQVEVQAPVIFITAYDEYAIEAFKHQGIDYILKPFDREDIRKALNKVYTLTQKADKGASPESEPTLPSPVGFQERFLVYLGAKIKSLPATDVAYFMADGKYLLLFTHSGASYIIDQTIGGIEERLDPSLFFRINRKFIISFNAIKEMIRYSNSRVKVILTPVPPENVEAIVSTERIKEFKQWLDK